MLLHYIHATTVTKMYTLFCITEMENRPRGKESTKVQITQNMGKERENLPKIEEISAGKSHKYTETN